MNGEAGKGDKPRNLGKKFHENYDLINWGHIQKPNSTVTRSDVIKKRKKP